MTKCYLIVGLLFLGGLTDQLRAQSGTISGITKDPTGEPVSSARVTVTNQGTNAETRLLTQGDGHFVAPFLPPGIYRIVAEKAGFKRFTFEDIKLDVQQSVSFNFTLQLGTISDSVEVTAQSAPLLSDSPSVESTVDRKQIQTLPLNTRDFNQLVLLAPGAVQNVNAGNGRDFGAVAANGNRSFSNDYLVDGVPNNNDYQGVSALPLSIDAIQEFKVTSGVAPAEYGYAGTQVSVATRSGTNTFHGSLFEYYRGTQMQARDPFSNTNSLPSFSRNQFGGSVGGPVMLPHYKGRNRTFFFLNYEGNIQNQSATRVATVPLDAFWSGDFSSLLARGIRLRDPLSLGNPVIPGNRLDQYLGGARLSSTARALQPFWGSPNGPGLTNNLVRTASANNNSHQFTARVDHQLPRNQQLSARLSYSTLDGFTPDLVANGAGLTQPVQNWNGSLTWTAPLSPNFVNEARLGGSNFYAPTTYETGGLPTVDSLGLNGFSPDASILPPLPRITFTGGDAFTQLNYGGDPNFGMAALLQTSRTYTLGDTVTWAHGRHTVKAGFEWRRTDLPSLQQTNARGSLSFVGSSGLNSTGYGFADFMMGIPSSASQVPVKSTVDLLQNQLATFIEDSWRVTDRLTLDLGLRHELPLNPTEAQNRLAIFDQNIGGIVVASNSGQLPTDQYLPAVVSKLANSSGAFPFPIVSDQEAGLAGRSILPTHTNYFGPRVGFAYQLGAARKTIIRSGYGIFYTRYPIQYLQQTAFVNPPFAGVFNYSQSIQAGVPLFTLASPYPNAKGSASVAPVGINRDFVLPYNQQWNLTVERELGQKTVMTLQYVGNKGTHLFRSINVNGPRWDPISRKVIYPYQSTFGTSAINFRQTDGNSIYNALLVELKRRAGRYLNFQANYTWAKQLDNTGTTVNSALLDVQNLGRDRADSDYTRRQQVTINGTYDLPFGHGRLFFDKMSTVADALLGGWRVSEIIRYTTGRYFTPTFTANGGLSNNRPDVVYGVPANLAPGDRTPSQWFNPGAFATVPAVDPALGTPRFGNAGRNILLGPGLNNVDASLAKQFFLGSETRALSLRLEAFNLFNHPNYDLPDANISNTNTVGTITNVVIPSRQVQLAVRFDF